MGKRIAKREVRPGLIVCSPAVRALTTAKVIAKEMGLRAADVVVDERIYGADPPELIDVIRDFDNRFDCIMLVGHNPTLTDLVNELTEADIDNVPTCGVAVLSFDVKKWKEVGNVTAQLLDFDYPKKGE